MFVNTVEKSNVQHKYYLNKERYIGMHTIRHLGKMKLIRI